MRRLYSKNLRQSPPRSIVSYREALRIVRANNLDLDACKEFLSAAIDDGIIYASDAAVIWRGIAKVYDTPFDRRSDK